MNSPLIQEARQIIGKRHVLVGSTQTRRFSNGYRFGGGSVVAVMRPGTLLEMWKILQLCVDAGHVIICQAANTGLTGGSTPAPEGYDRQVVIINTLRLTHLSVILDGAQVVSQPGVSLDQLEHTLKPLGREPHSLIGSSCIGASITGGVCNNSGGSLVQRGPAYTQMALFARINEQGKLELLNHLGIDLGDTPEEIFTRLDNNDIPANAIDRNPERWGSDREYAEHVRDLDAASPARFNADPRRLYEASGSAGRLAVFALRLDTFAAQTDTKVFYIGAHTPQALSTIRADILRSFKHLPVAGEYMHRGAYDISRRYGKDVWLFIRRFGTQRIMRAFAIKSRFDAITRSLGLGSRISDRLIQWFTDLLPEHLPARMNAYRDRFPHHLLLKMSGPGIEEARHYLTDRLPNEEADFFECTTEEGEAAFLARFAIGGGVVRYRSVHTRQVEDIVALDVALPRNASEFFETLPTEIAEKIDYVMYCGHFLCHVMHQEYLVKKGEDCDQVKEAILERLTTIGARYPAEHNVGHLYAADDTLRAFYRQLDPTNTFNPGIGKTSKLVKWGCEQGLSPCGHDKNDANV